MDDLKKVVVFGGSGYLGSHVADALSKKGFNVVIFDIAESPYINDNQKTRQLICKKNYKQPPFFCKS